jgi:invasion protein IalB
MSEMPPPPTSTRIVGGLPPVAITAAIWAGLVIVGGLLGWIGKGVLAGPPDVPTTLVFGDWHTSCPDAKQKDAACRVSEDLSDPKSGQPLANLVVMKQIDKDNKIATVMAVNVVPFNVVAIQAGIGLKFGNEVKSYQYKTCMANGCFALVPYDQQLENAIKGASDASIVVGTINGKSVQLSFSTKGFADARKASLDIDAKHASWWWRLWS